MGTHFCVARHPLWVSLAQSAFAAAVAVGELTAGQAWAYVVNVSGYGYWDVTLFDGSYNNNNASFDTPPAPGQYGQGRMPWWGSEAGAREFADAVRYQVLPSIPQSDCPDPQICNPPTTGGLYFGWGSVVDTTNPNAPVPIVQSVYYLYPPSDPDNGSIEPINIRQAENVSWAQAITATPGVPGPLPVLGIATWIGYSRRLRSRLKKSGNSVSSTYSL